MHLICRIWEAVRRKQWFWVERLEGENCRGSGSGEFAAYMPKDVWMVCFIE